MKEKDIGNLNVENDPFDPTNEPQGWCSPEFPSGCLLDTDFE